MMKANSENQSGQSIQNGESGFTECFRFSALLCRFLRCVKNRAKVGWRYSTYFGAAFWGWSSLFGLCSK